LQPILWATSITSKLVHGVKNRPETTLEKSDNLFDLLELEEVGEGSYPVPLPSTSKKPKATYTKEFIAEEKLFALYCFFSDFQIVREHVEETWQSYERGGR
jgi:hypothetical protein